MTDEELGIPKELSDEVSDEDWRNDFGAETIIKFLQSVFRKKL